MSYDFRRLGHRAGHRLPPGVWLLALPLAVTLAVGCKRPSTKKQLAPLAWKGLRLGQSQTIATTKAKALGWTMTCKPATTVLYLDGDTLATQWVRSAAKKRTVRCTARLPRPSGMKPAKPEGTPRLMRAVLFFLDDRLVRMNILMATEDPVFAKRVHDKWGRFDHKHLTIRLYGAKKRGRIRAQIKRHGQAAVIWLRKARAQELIFVTTDPKQIKTLKQITTEKRGG